MAKVTKTTKEVEVEVVTVQRRQQKIYNIELAEEEAMALIAVIGRVCNNSRNNDNIKKLHRFICQLHVDLGDAGVPYGYEEENIFRNCIRQDMQLG